MGVISNSKSNNDDEAGASRPSVTHASGPSATHSTTVPGKKRFPSLFYSRKLEANNLSRRHFVFGSLAMGIGSSLPVILKGADPRAKDAHATNFAYAASYYEAPTLSVPSENIVPSSDFNEVTEEEERNILSEIAYAELPYGSIVFSTCSGLSACLCPLEGSAHPLCKALALYTDSATTSVLLNQALLNRAGFDIFDIRISHHGIAWTECNIMSGIWCLFAAPFNKDNALAGTYNHSEGASLAQSLSFEEASRMDIAATPGDVASATGAGVGRPILMAFGDNQWQCPPLSAVEKYVYWQLMPNKNGELSEEPSTLNRAAFGEDYSEVVYESNGRFSAPPFIYKKSLVISPRVPDVSTTYQIKKFNAETLADEDAITLPSGMTPFNIGYGPNGFSFSFLASYSYGGGISQWGTYYPMSSGNNYSDSGLKWLHHGTAPTAPISTSGKFFASKSSISGIILFDTANSRYATIPVESGSDNYGIFLASSGDTDTLVTYANIDTLRDAENPRRLCSVRIWSVS